MTASDPGKAARLEMIHTEPSCRKCRATEAVLNEIAKERPGAVTVSLMTIAQAEAAGYGVVLTPTVLLNGQVVCAGIVPRKDGVLRLVDAELARA